MPAMEAGDDYRAPRALARKATNATTANAASITTPMMTNSGKPIARMNVSPFL
jgi:hypothetical protein